MSTPTPQYGNNPPMPGTVSVSMPATPPQVRKNEILVVSHSSLFYWWPVWATAFILGFLTLFSNHVMVTVPSDTKWIAYKDESKKNDNTIKYYAEVTAPEKPRLHMTTNKNFGVLFCVVLLLVIAITNVPLRGLWSVIVIVVIISLAIIFALLEWWERILNTLSFLDIRINAGGYFVIAGVLFALWLVVTMLFDRQIYMVFTPGQLRVRQEIGDAETAYDTTGMIIQKQRSDLFRHWILGIGSGDLIVKTAGAHSHEFHMNNVLFIGRKVKEIEEMLRSRQVVSGQTQ